MPSLELVSDPDREPEAMDADRDAPAPSSKSSIEYGHSHTPPSSLERLTESEHWHTPPSSPKWSTESDHWFTPPSGPGSDSGRFPIGMHSPGLSGRGLRPLVDNLECAERGVLIREFSNCQRELKSKAKVSRRITGTATGTCPGAVNAAQ